VSTGDDPIVFEVAPPTTVEAAKWKLLFWAL
jgi:hypothetical protein